MKRAFSILTVLMMCLLTISSAAEVGEDHEYIISKIRIVYGLNGDLAEEKGYSVKLDIASAVNATSNIFYDNPNMYKSWDELVKKLINDVQHGGDPELQRYVADIMKITEQDIICYFFDDDLSEKEIWPHAESYKEDKPFGKIFIGCRFVNRSKEIEVVEMFLHELMHTQDRISYYDMSFWIGGKWYNYGFNKEHRFYEAVPSVAAATNEGLANAIAMYFTKDFGLHSIDKWFGPERLIKVEKTPLHQSGYPGKHRDIWLYDQLVEAKVPTAELTDDNAWYRIADLPPYFLLHNEGTIATLIYLYMRHSGYKSVLEAIVQFNHNEIFRTGGDLQTLMSILCQEGLPESWKSRSIDDLGYCQSSEGPMKYLLPLAYADYLTGFKVKTQQEFSKLFDNGLHIQLFDCYWLVRESVKTAAGQEQDILQASMSIARILGMIESK